MLLRIFERIRRQAAQLRGLIGALNGVLPPTPDPDQEHGASDENGDEKGYEKGGGKGNGKDEGKGEGKFPGKHPNRRPWTDEEVDEYHNDLFVVAQLFGSGSRRRRRPSQESASDGAKKPRRWPFDVGDAGGRLGTW